MSAQKGGFSLIEVMVAIVLMTVVGITFAGTVTYAARMTGVSGRELGRSSFTRSEVERLQALPFDSLRTDSRTLPEGTSRWMVADSGAFRAILLVVAPGGERPDTVALYRMAP